KTKPNHCLPFDLVLLSDAKKIVVHYYRIKENLHLYYNHNLIKGFEKFIFKDFDKMIKKFDSPKKVWEGVNKFRISNGHKRLTNQKYRLVEYNEIIFNKPVKIKPVALFGYRKEARILAKKYGLKHFRTARKFYERLQK
ncbi:hypothetical protein K8R33_00195, partial [archaeon]|nr:hypothetical protein [archaeon]